MTRKHTARLAEQPVGVRLRLATPSTPRYGFTRGLTLAEVYANDMAIVCAAGDAKCTAAFPDVCKSPPGPPAGPIPLPYPNTSFARDLKKGSKSVKIGGKPVALYGVSYWSSSPLGNEAATRAFGGSLLTGTITGETHHQAHAMDVCVEGRFVCRHLDLVTCNHGSYPGSTPPFPACDKSTLAANRARVGL